MQNGDSSRRGICYRCMYGEHKFCYGDNGKTVCQCRMMGHELKLAKLYLGKDPDSDPPKFPEEPAANDRFYFI